jgi:tetratricopeptide (TPR) repeat protein
VIFEDLTRLRAANGRHWACLGRLLQRRGYLAGARMALEKAVATLCAAIQVKPEDFQAHWILGVSLEAQGKLAEAAAEYRATIRLKPDSASAHNNLGMVLFAQGKLAESIAEYRAATHLAHDYAAPHHNLGVALRVQGKDLDAIAEFRAAVRLDGDLVGEAPFALGETLRGIGRYGEAIDLYRGLRQQVRDNPRLHQRVTTELADVERQAALAARLPAVLHGDDTPKDAAEGLDFALLAYHARQFGPSAQLYAESFRDDPRLAEDMAAKYRYRAARAAALAAAGKGIEEPPLDEPAKARWRQQALDWLAADLAYGTKLVQTGPPEAKDLVSQILQFWKTDPDLAGIRDPAALEELPEAQRRAWRDLWAAVEALIQEP